jgi:hypothetical protein
LQLRSVPRRCALPSTVHCAPCAVSNRSFQLEWSDRAFLASSEKAGDLQLYKVVLSKYGNRVLLRDVAERLGQKLDLHFVAKASTRFDAKAAAPVIQIPVQAGKYLCTGRIVEH